MVAERKRSDVEIHQLVERAQRGDEEAFASLIAVVGDRLHTVAHRILRDMDLASDATQQALLRIWRDLPQLREPERFEAWAYRLVVRSCYDEVRRSRRGAPKVQLLPSVGAEAPDHLRRVADRDELDRAFRRLSLEHRSVLVLHHFLDLSLDEVAVTLSVPVGTVRSRLHYAMRALRALLEADARGSVPEGVR